MGLLDDAIREHLDLKRRRGADPTEVERSEREALGPVRRTPERVPGDGSELDPDASGLDPDAGPGTAPAPGAVYDDGLVSPDEPGAAAFAPSLPEGREPAGAAHVPSEPHPDRLDHSTLPGPVGADDDESSWSYDQPSGAAGPGVAPPDETVPPPHRADSTRLEGDAGHTAEYDVASALSSEHGAAEPARHDLEAAEPHTREAPLHEQEHGTPSGQQEDEDVLEETPEFLQDTPDHDRLWFEQRPPRDFDFNG